MKWIVVTSPSFFEGEERFISTLLAMGVDAVHLRKPDGSTAQAERLLSRLTEEERRRIVTHDFFNLAVPFSLGGVHLNRRNTTVPQGFRGTVSRSCHSLEEVKKHKDECDYLFLSPVFDSISKSGYRAAFTEEALSAAAESGVIDAKVYALGGVTHDALPLLRRWHFGGAAMLGCISCLATLEEASLKARLAEIKKFFQ